jgi:ATP adenylyltransferase
MIVIPRRFESWQGIALSAMGFAGSFFVRSDDDLERLRAAGPARVLAEAGQPPG